MLNCNGNIEYVARSFLMKLEWIWSEFGVNICRKKLWQKVLECNRDHSDPTRAATALIRPKCTVNNTNVHSKFTLISLFSKIHSLKSEHIHSFLSRVGIVKLAQE